MSENSRSGHGGIITVIVIVVLLVVALITCPDKNAHKEAILSVINEKITESIQTNSKEGEDVLAVLGATLGTSVSGWVLDKGLIVDNYFIFSIGKFNTGQDYKTVSVGVFGHVFTFSKEDMEEYLQGLGK